MNARIDIRTPSGQSLEGFPKTENIDALNVSVKSDGETNITRFISLWENEHNVKIDIGDQIIIEVLA